MPSRRAISLSLLATSVGQSKETSGMVQPKPAASAISWRTCEPITNSFFGTQPRITQVPPIRYSSATMTLALWLAAMRAARTPPEPPPMTNRSTSNSAISTPPEIVSPDQTSLSNFQLDFLAALAHLGAELGVHRFGKDLRPLVHIGHAELNGPGLVREQLLTERRLVERHQVLEFLFGKLVGVNLRHAIADFLFAACQGFGDNDSNFIEILLIVEVVLQQRILGLLDDIGNGAGIHRAGVLHRQDLLGRRDGGRRSRLERRGPPRRDRLLRSCGNTGQSQSQGKARGRQNS